MNERTFFTRRFFAILTILLCIFAYGLVAMLILMYNMLVPSFGGEHLISLFKDGIKITIIIAVVANIFCYGWCRGVHLNLVKKLRERNKNASICEDLL